MSRQKADKGPSVTSQQRSCSWAGKLMRGHTLLLCLKLLRLQKNRLPEKKIALRPSASKTAQASFPAIYFH